MKNRACETGGIGLSAFPCHLQLENYPPKLSSSSQPDNIKNIIWISLSTAYIVCRPHNRGPRLLAPTLRTKKWEVQGLFWVCAVPKFLTVHYVAAHTVCRVCAGPKYLTLHSAAAHCVCRVCAGPDNLTLRLRLCGYTGFICFFVFVFFYAFLII
jgi:hypothetical protein